MILLCDTNGLAYRSYFTSSLTTSDGEHVAIPHYGIKTFWNLLDRFRSADKPTACVAVWDGGRSRARMEAYPQYKAKREESRPSNFSPEMFYKGCDMLTEAFKHLGIPHLKRRHVEADDIIAQLAKAATDTVMIVSTDKDFWQLISENVSVYSPTKDEVITIGTFKQKTGYKSPSQYLRVRILTGDESDNIIGLKGVGPKTALKYVESGKSLHQLLKAKELKTRHGYSDGYIVRRNAYLMDLAVNPDRLELDSLLNEIVVTQRDIRGYKNYLHSLEFEYLFSKLDEYMPYFEALTDPRELLKGDKQCR